MAVVAYVLLTVACVRRPGPCAEAGRKAMSRAGDDAERSDQEGAAQMSYDNTIGLALSAVFAVYLVAALYFPERF